MGGLVIWLGTAATALILASPGIRSREVAFGWEGEPPLMKLPADERVTALVPCGPAPKRLYAMALPCALCLPVDETPVFSELQAACIEHGTPDLRPDGVIDAGDANVFLQELTANRPGSPADLNGDGAVNAGDVAIFVPLLGGVMASR